MDVHITGNIKFKTDFEKLTIARLYIQQLKGEIGMLESEKDELQYEVDRLKNMPKEELYKEIKAEIIEKQTVTKSQLEKTIFQLKKDRDNLLNKLLVK